MIQIKRTYFTIIFFLSDLIQHFCLGDFIDVNLPLEMISKLDTKGKNYKKKDFLNWKMSNVLTWESDVPISDNYNKTANNIKTGKNDFIIW